MDPNVWHWFAEYGAVTFNGYKIGPHGATPYERANGRESSVSIAAFGEQAYYHITKKHASTRQKVNPAWKPGMFLGQFWVSNEHAVGTEKGVITSNSIKPMIDDQCWGILVLDRVKGTPRRPNPNKAGHEIPTVILEGEDEQEDVEAKAVVVDDGDVASVDVRSQ